MKKYLLDTHTLIWAIVDDDKLSKSVLNILHDNDNLLFISAVSFWEMAIKNGKGKMNWENLHIQEIPYYCKLLGIEQIPLTPEDAINYRLPCQRMLLVHAQNFRYTQCRYC